MTENVGSELTSSFDRPPDVAITRPLQRPGPGRRADLAARARHGHAARAGIQSDRAITTIMTDIKAEFADAYEQFAQVVDGSGESAAAWAG
ncbi:MAG: hypothetical protein ACLQRH_10145 [Acidimicrobiales bacterium]